MTSGGQYAQALDLDDLEDGDGHYDGTRAYARAKRAQVTLIREWARRLGRPGSASIRCIRAGPTRPACRQPCPASPG